jgi:hypothetical protein
MSNVRFFHRCLADQVVDFEDIGWTEVARHPIPSLDQDVVLMERSTLPDPKPEKLRWSLLLVMLGEQVRDVVRGLQYGATKHHEDANDPQYRKTKDPMRVYGDKALRHLLDHLAGKVVDEESGVKNWSLAICNLLFLGWHSDNSPKR